MNTATLHCDRCYHPMSFCQCLPPAVTTPDASVFTCSWKERLKECQQRGEMIGMLMSVRFMVDVETRKNIEEFLKEIEV